MSKEYAGFESIRKAYKEMPPAGSIYTSVRIDSTSILNATYFVIPSLEIENYVDEEGEYVPDQVAGKGYYSWLEAPTFADIIIDKLEQNSSATLDDFIEAVLYYLEYDNFID